MIYIEFKNNPITIWRVPMQIMSFIVTMLLLGTNSMALCVNKKIKPDIMTEIFLKRHSGYSYDAQRLVTRDQLQTIIETGRLAPSSYNDQPWYFIICDRTTNPTAYKKVFDALIEFNQQWVKNVPVLIVVVAAWKSHNSEWNRHAQYDTGAAAFGMMLQATSLGLMAHQMGGFDEVKIKESFNLPDDYVPMSVMAIGYEAENKAVKKERKPVEHNFFDGAWGTGWK
jgi:nitroreductase